MIDLRVRIGVDLQQSFLGHQAFEGRVSCTYSTLDYHIKATDSAIHPYMFLWGDSPPFELGLVE